MFGTLSKAEVGRFEVHTSSGTGLPAAHWAKLATNKIISVGGQSHPLVAQQAQAFKEQIEKVLIHYIVTANLSYKDTLAGELERQGHSDMAKILRSM